MKTIKERMNDINKMTGELKEAHQAMLDHDTEDALEVHRDIIAKEEEMDRHEDYYEQSYQPEQPNPTWA